MNLRFEEVVPLFEKSERLDMRLRVVFSRSSLSSSRSYTILCLYRARKMPPRNSAREESNFARTWLAAASGELISL
jgi:hypothetical protein